MREMPDVTFIAPDLRGYPATETSKGGYDVMTLTNDIDQLISALNLEKPILLTHDWGGALGWIYAHRFPNRISQLVVINCPHPKTLVRAVFHCEDFQTLRIPWVPPFQIPYFPERLLTSQIGRKLLELSFTLREGSKGHMERDLVREIVNRFQHSVTMRGPVNYYREIVRTLLHTKSRKQLYAIYDKPIAVPVTLIWGLEDGALSAKVAQKSYLDAGCHVEWRPLEGIGHFVDLEASDLLAQELYRLPELKMKTALSKNADVTAA
jgi:pimeloyl-ACP methyl ester carboxylesterase